MVWKSNVSGICCTCNPGGPVAPLKPRGPSSPLGPYIPCCPGALAPHPDPERDISTGLWTHTEFQPASPSHWVTHTTLIHTVDPGCPGGPWLPGGPGGPCEIKCRYMVIHTSNESSCIIQHLWQDRDTNPLSLVSFAAFLPWSSCLPLKNILMPINNNQHEHKHVQLLKK